MQAEKATTALQVVAAAVGAVLLAAAGAAVGVGKNVLGMQPAALLAGEDASNCASVHSVCQQWRVVVCHARRDAF